MKIDDELIEKVNKRYQECLNKTQVGRELNLSIYSINKCLNEESLELAKLEKESYDALWYYIIRQFGVCSEKNPVSAWNICQTHKFKNNNISYRSQLLILKYIYEVKKKKIKKKDGSCSIGLIPYYYWESVNYYKKEADRIKILNKEIREQLEKDRIEIPYKPRKTVKNKHKKEISLEDLDNDSN